MSHVSPVCEKLSNDERNSNRGAGKGHILSDSQKSTQPAKDEKNNHHFVVSRDQKDKNISNWLQNVGQKYAARTSK